MTWKERFKPDNNAEAGCYKIVLLVAFLLLAEAASSAETAYMILLAMGTLFLIAAPINGEIQMNYEVSRIRAFALSIILSFAILASMIAVAVGTAMLLAQLSFVPEQVMSIIFLAVIAALGWLGAKLIQPIKILVYDRILKLPAKTSDNNLAD